MGGAGGGFGADYHQAPPLSGQKRGFPFSERGASPPGHLDGGSFAKLFIGSVPRTATEENIRPLFEEHGNVVEVALIKDKRTGQQQGCCFIKYATSEEADTAIRALHNQHTLPGGVGPIQVRYADGERERLGAVEYKLFVGSLNKHATEKEVEEIFSKYGRVEDVYLMRDSMKLSRGCGFVKFSHRDMAVAAINALNGIYTMRGCDQPLTVRFADPKRPRPGDSRGPAFGGPGVGPRYQAPGARPEQSFGGPMGDRIAPKAWHPMSPPNLRPPSDADIHGFGGQLLPRSGDIALPLNTAGPLSGVGGPADGSPLGHAVTSQQSFNFSTMQGPPVSQQISPLFQKPTQSPQHLAPSLQSHPQTPASYTNLQTPLASQQLGQPQLPHSAGQTTFSQALPSQQLLGLGGQLSVSQPQVCKIASSATELLTPLDISFKPLSMSTLANQQPSVSVPQQLLQPLQQPPSQLAQMLSQQTQTLQASFQSSQQAFSQLQQQLQLMQPSNQGFTSQQSSQTIKQQSQWAGTVPQTVPIALSTTPAADVPSAKPAAPAVPLIPQAVAPVKCNWTEHTSPDGYKYYHNSATGESRWERPEELMLLEHQQQQKQLVQPRQTQSHPQVPSAQQARQTQQVQLQAQPQTLLHHHQQLQQPTLSSSYQASGVTVHQNIQVNIITSNRLSTDIMRKIFILRNLKMACRHLEDAELKSRFETH
ncbi:Flowering time control protein FCA [Morella rubra]|uniref:Flowering time control protein FCA n=1 Tax=Morella rubra TaxID=262757 RepID=A0A6A1UMT0_9ROSI|nr:Flowering time control protein FCA [Morella rubra]